MNAKMNGNGLLASPFPQNAKVNRGIYMLPERLFNVVNNEQT